MSNPQLLAKFNATTTNVHSQSPQFGMSAHVQPNQLNMGSNQLQNQLRPVDPTQEVISKKKLQELLNQMDSREKLDDDVEEILIQIADEFIDNVANFACTLAKHRKSDTLEVKDIALHLERNWNIRIPGYSSTEDLKPYKKATIPESHKQRLALIRKTTQSANPKAGPKKTNN